jgi:UDP-N-acetylmuramate dehydrogenase
LPKRNLYKSLLNKVRGTVKLGEMLSTHTTLQVGGPADLMISPVDKQDLIQILNYSQDKNLPFYILGWGSNMLISDEGFPGIVIHLQEHLNHFSIQGNKVVAEAGSSVPMIIQETLENNLTGLDFMYGIPGTIGGCTYMNAGSKLHSIGDVIIQVNSFNLHTREEKSVDSAQLNFQYRQSIFQKKQDIILSVDLQLIEGKKQEELQKLRLAKESRRNTQPLQYPNAGCIWKNPPGFSAGKLIEETGLKGYQIGGAQVSNIHANFIVNYSRASALDILRLIRLVETKVLEKTGIKLDREIQLLGNFTL